MKTMIFTILTILTLSVGVANADPVGQTLPQQNGSQYNLTAGDAGWG